MSKITCVKCDLCGKIDEELSCYTMEIRKNLPQNAAGTVETFDLCPDCKNTLGTWIQSKKPSDVPIINTGGVI